MRIGELSEPTNTSRRLLRHCEEQGLLLCERSPNGYRSCDERYVDRVPQIRALPDAGPHPLPRPRPALARQRARRSVQGSDIR
jgi:DNA-binding transcriptional MerR regulator